MLGKYLAIAFPSLPSSLFQAKYTKHRLNPTVLVTFLKVVQTSKRSLSQSVSADVDPATQNKSGPLSLDSALHNRRLCP